MKKYLVLFLVVPLFFSFIWAEDDVEDLNETEKEKIQSLLEERRETLLFGIDTEVLSLIKEIKDEKDPALNEELSILFNETINRNIKIQLIDFFLTLDENFLEKGIVDILDDWQDQETDLVKKCFQYIRIFKVQGKKEILWEIIDDDDESYLNDAIETIGLIGDEEDSKKLIELLDNTDYIDSAPQIIRSLGEIGSSVAVDPLIDIVEDEYEENTNRRYAAAALGSIGDEKAIPILEKLFSDEDTILRFYVTSALSNFKSDVINTLLKNALRDSYWKVRIEAAKGLAENGDLSAVPILIYKAKKDPEKNVKNAAYQALGKLNTEETREFLSEQVLSDFIPADLRYTAIISLGENNMKEAVITYEKLMDKEWDHKDSKIFGTICRYLSETESTETSSLIEKMLTHDNYIIKIYGVKGAMRNNLITLRDTIKSLEENESQPAALRKVALSAVEEF